MFLLLLVALVISVAFLIGLLVYVIQENRKSRTEAREAKSDAQLARSDARIAREQSDMYLEAMESMIGASVRNPDGDGPADGRHLHSVADAAPGVIDRFRDVARRNHSSAAALVLIAACCAYAALTLPGHVHGDGPMAFQLPDQPSPIPTITALASDHPVPMSDPQPSTAAQPSVTPTTTATEVSFVASSTRQPSPSAPPEAQPVPPSSPPSSPNPTTSTALKVCVSSVHVAGVVQSPCVAP
jgi:hypothetical protein